MGAIMKIEVKDIEDYGVYFPKRLDVFGNRMIINREKAARDNIELHKVVMHELLHHVIDKYNLTNMEGVATVIGEKWEVLNVRTKEIEERIYNRETSFVVDDL